MKKVLIVLILMLTVTHSQANTLLEEVPFEYKGKVGNGLHYYSIDQNTISGLCYVRYGAAMSEVPCESVGITSLKDKQLKSYLKRKALLEQTIKGLQEQLNNMESN
ncbi:lipoprotein [Vibrio phage K406]